MVAYSFNKRFIKPIQSGRKRQTIRAVGKRVHAREGSKLQLYTAMRTKHCRKIMHVDPKCKSCESILIDVHADRIASIEVGCMIIGDKDAFAVSDGFEDARDMHAFWLKSHGVGLFEGLIIRW